MPIVGNGSTSPLAVITVVPFAKENAGTLCTAVRADTSGGAYRQRTGTRLRSRHMMNVTTGTTSVPYRAAAKDLNGLWTEWSDPVSLGTTLMVQGTNVVSIGQGYVGTDDTGLQEPGAAFPKLSLGSNQGGVRRTLFTSTFYDEARREMVAVKRAAFKCVFNDVDQQQTQCLHRWFRALNGNWKPFTFDYYDPGIGRDFQYVVRFRDPQFTDELFAMDRSRIEFTLIEVSGRIEGIVA
jgi:hypothetical protein